jgi:tetratricopeptide (TPR) repeat protein
MRIVFFLIACISLGSPLGAQAFDLNQAQSDFRAANERLLKGDAKGALALYEHLVSENVVSADLYFNLGNSYASLDRPLDAIVAYERSRQIDASNSDSTKHNLLLMRRNLDPLSYSEDEAIQVHEKEPLDMIQALVTPLDANLFAWILLVANFIFFASVGLRRYTRNESHRRIALVTLGGSVVFVLFSALVTAGYFVIRDDQLAVVSRSSPLKEGPNNRFEIQGEARIGDRVRALDHEDEWTEVKTDSGEIGWIQNGVLRRL